MSTDIKIPFEADVKMPDLKKKLPKGLRLGIFKDRKIRPWSVETSTIGGSLKITVHKTKAGKSAPDATVAKTFKKNMLKTGVYKKALKSAEARSQIKKVVYLAIAGGDAKKIKNSLNAFARQVYYAASKLKKNSKKTRKIKGFSSWGINTGTTFRSVEGRIEK